MDRSRLEEILEQDEDRRNEKYRDSENKWTIGIGHLMATKVQPNAYSLATGETVGQPTRLPSDVGSISNEAIDEILSDDIDASIGFAINWLGRSPSRFESLSDVRQEVITSMAFIFGPNKLAKFVDTKAAILAEDWDAAGMRDSLWWRCQARNRAERLASAMESNDPDLLSRTGVTIGFKKFSVNVLLREGISLL